VLSCVGLGLLVSCTGPAGRESRQMSTYPHLQSSSPSAAQSPPPHHKTHQYFAQVSAVRDRPGSSLLAVSKVVDDGVQQRRHDRLLLARPGRRLQVVPLPAGVTQLGILSAAALDAKHLWVVTNECATPGAQLWRTRDSGLHWRHHRIPGPNCAAGSTDSLDLLDPRHGLLTVIFANAPGADLYRTADAGRRWRQLASMSGDQRGKLPIDGPIQQASDGSLWLAGGVWPSKLWVSDGIGAAWRHVTLAGVRGPRYLTPSVLGAEIVQPLTSARNCNARTPRFEIFRSLDGGGHWKAYRVRLPGRIPSRGCDTITAVSAQRLWLTHSTSHGEQLYTSHDTGQHWHSVNVAAL